MSNMVIQTNVLALNSHRNLRTIATRQFQASARLSSGYKINSAADDAAGLAISEKMRAQIRGLDMASKNTQDGISLVQTAEGGLQEVDNMIQRIRELVVQAANDTNDFKTNDRKKIQDEVNQLTQGIDNMARQVEFNAKKLLNGGLMDELTKAELLADVDLRLTRSIGGDHSKAGGVGTIVKSIRDSIGTSEAGKIYEEAYNLGAAISVAVAALSVGTTASNRAIAIYGSSISAAFSTGTGTVGWQDIASLEAFIDGAGELIAILTAGRASAAAGGQDVTVYDEGIDGLRGQIDAAQKLYATVELSTARYGSYQALDGVTGDGLWFQTGANSMQGIMAGVGSITSDILGIGYGHGQSSVNVDTQKGYEVSAYIDIVDDALQYVTAQRAKLGAIQNRMEFTKNSLEISSENLSSAESRIRDADMGKEMMKMTAANILQQAGVSMLAQANQAPQSVLQLLR